MGFFTPVRSSWRRYGHATNHLPQRSKPATQHFAGPVFLEGDGHGLHAIKTESSWHCSKPRLFEFGGSGCFLGTHVFVDRSSGASVRLGQDLETALVAKNVDEAAAVFLDDVRDTLSGIGDATTRDLIRVKLAELLVAPGASADVTS